MKNYVALATAFAEDHLAMTRLFVEVAKREVAFEAEFPQFTNGGAQEVLNKALADLEEAEQHAASVRSRYKELLGTLVTAG